MDETSQRPLLLGGWLFVAFILTCSALSYIDRQVISLLVQPLKASLHISDTQVGLLQGFAFSLCYAIAGLPLALAIDRGDRARIAAGCIALWSAAVACCGLATSFPTFLAARAATAATESGYSPAVLSMLTDRFPRAKVPRMTAVYLMGPPLGAGLSLLIGGWLLGEYNQTGGLTLPLVGHLEPWQAVFVTLAPPGFVLAAIFALTIRDPHRTAARKAAEQAESRGFAEEVRAVGGVLIPYILGTVLIMAVTFSLQAWAPTLFARRYGMEPHQVGKTLGPIFMVCGLIAAAMASFLAGGGRDERAVRRVMRIVLVGAVICGPAAVALALTPSYNASLALYAVTAVSGSMVASLATSPIQLLVSAAVRARAIAIGGFCVSVIASGAGPFLVGYLTDAFGNEAAIGKSIAVVCGVAGALGLIALVIAWRGEQRAAAAA